MKKNSSSKRTFLLLFLLAFIIFSFKDPVYSKTDTTGIPVESNPRGIAINPITDIAVIANEKADSVSIVNLNTQAVILTIPVGKAPRGVAIDKGLNLAVIGNSHDNTICIIDLNIYQVTATIPVGKEPEGIAVNQLNHTALIANHKDNTVSVIDLANHNVIGTVAVGKEPKDVAIDSELNLALVVNEKFTLPFIPSRQGRGDFGVLSPLAAMARRGEGGGEGGVSVIDLNTNQVTGTVPVGQKPQAISINPETHIAAVVNEKDNTVSLIALSSYLSFRLDRNLSEGLPTSGNDIRGSATTILVCKHPISIAINQLDNHALVISDEDRVLQLIALNTPPPLPSPLVGAILRGDPLREGEGWVGGKVIKTYPLNKLPKGIAVNQFTNIAAVVDDKTDSLTLIQLPNPVPEIISINPDTLLRGSSETTVTIQGSGFIKSSSVSFLPATPYTLHAEFIDNHNLKATIPNDLLLNAGTYQISVTNPTPDGGISSPVNLQINNPVPTISAIDPLEVKAGIQLLTLTIYGTGFFPDTEIYFGNIKKPITYISLIKLQIPLTSEDLKTAGQYEIVVRNLSPGGGYSSKAILTIKPSLEIIITSPIDNETINKAKAMVKGTFKSDTKDVGITVNGVLADVIPEGSNRGTSNQWIANNIPLQTGANTITATIKDSEGNTESASITINTTDTSQAVTLSANITSGIPPLQVYFSTSTSTSTFSPALFQMDFEGDGVIDYTGATFEDITHTYTQEGIFYPTLTVTDAQGNTYSDAIAITILNKTEIDTLLKGKWEGMKGELKAQNINTALNYLTEDIKNKFQGVFSALGEDLPVIVSNLPDMKLISVKDGRSKYYIKKLENGKEYAYFIYFVRDENGIWKIENF